jgi:hypothetical protein
MSINRCAYSATLAAFQSANPNAILGALATSQTGDLTPAQRDAWLRQIEVLKLALTGIEEGTVHFEFLIPRMGKRADCVLTIAGLLVVIEFKVGAEQYDRAAKDQAIDYALDLRNFHAGSHQLPIVPILVATDAPAQPILLSNSIDNVYDILLANATTLRDAINVVTREHERTRFDYQRWLAAGYHPTPTIVEASQVLYRTHSVAEITRMEAGVENLGATTSALQTIIDKARANCSKAICFVTGVPGAGKTLAGLNLVSLRRRREENQEEHAVFLSGNGPLVKVLQEALARDQVQQARAIGKGTTKNQALREAHAFIQNIHHFRDECLKDSSPPVERVVVFDEAQRAWDREQTSSFMKRKRGHRDFDLSEPAFLISVMDRHQAWSVIICLVGNGQEINTGEAGLEEWLIALRDRFPRWQIYMPDKKTAAEFIPNFNLDQLDLRASYEPTLHLNVSLRSFRAERLSEGVAALLHCRPVDAREEFAAIGSQFPIRVTRSIDLAKNWIRRRARGTERTGLLASSGAMRLKPLGIAMGLQVDPCVWFLNGSEDVRSSYYLEDAASEFDVQGLELDWAVIVWDGDLIYEPTTGGWRYRDFTGTKWNQIRSAAAQRYRLNAYRVLLTRARQGMAIVVPEGDALDPTRNPSFYDPTWNYLLSLGLRQLPDSATPSLTPSPQELWPTFA